MKVLHISLYDRHGGACIATYRQHEALRREGEDSVIWARYRLTGDRAVLEYRPQPGLVRKAARVIRRSALAREGRRSVTSGVYLEDRTEVTGAELSNLPEADVINVQSFWRFVDLGSLLRTLPPDKPVVVTMHEMAPFTGGCSYAGSCQGFHRRCGHCPMMVGGEHDLSRRSWERKAEAFRARAPGKLHFVADSNWLEQEARRSGLLQGYPISTIHYGVDTETFRPGDKREARLSLGLPEEGPVLAFAAAFVNDERKGFRYLLEAVRRLPFKPALLTWGQNFPEGLEDYPHRHLGPVQDEHLLALAYRSADAFVMPSLEEAFGQTALESIACGRPVVAFAAGGIPEIVLDGTTGLLAPVGDSAALAEQIRRLLGDPALQAALGQAGRAWALDRFTYARNARRYRELYQSLL